MSDTKQTSPQYDTSANLPSDAHGKPNFPIALLDAHETQPIETQAKVAQQDWRTIAFVLAQRAKNYARSFVKADAPRMHAIVQAAGIAYDKAYKGGIDIGRGPRHVLITLFGASGAGEAIARNLTKMIPIAKVVDDGAGGVDGAGERIAANLTKMIPHAKVIGSNSDQVCSDSTMIAPHARVVDAEVVASGHDDDTKPVA